MKIAGSLGKKIVQSGRKSLKNSWYNNVLIVSDKINHFIFEDYPAYNQCQNFYKNQFI